MFINRNKTLKNSKKILKIGGFSLGLITVGTIVCLYFPGGRLKWADTPLQQDENYTDWVKGKISDETERGYIIDLEGDSGFVDHSRQFVVNRQVFTGEEEFLLEIGQSVQVMLNRNEIDWEGSLPFAKTVFDIYILGNSANGKIISAPRTN